MEPSTRKLWTAVRWSWLIVLGTVGLLVVIEARMSGAALGQLSGIAMMLLGVFKFCHPRRVGSILPPPKPSRLDLLFLAVILSLLVAGSVLR